MNASRRSTRKGRSGLSRRGKALVLFALLLPPLVGGMALSIDTGIIGTARAQMRTVTDSAALAGAMQLASENRVRGATNLSTEISLAQSHAIDLAKRNWILKATPVIFENRSNASNGDVIVGFLEPSSSATTVNNGTSLTPFFNSVQVTARRTADQGGLVPTPFGSIFGSEGAALTIRSIATVMPYTIQGFTNEPNVGTSLLPIVLEKPIYDAMIGRPNPAIPSEYTPADNYTFNPTTGKVTTGADGVKESLIYGVKKVNLPGNWGTVKIGVNNNSTSTLSAQIRYGITPQQLANMGGSIQLDPITKTLILKGNPGLSAAIKDDLEAIKGRPVTIPIYEGSGGNGNNAWYEIVEFAAVRIVKVQLTGNNKHVIVQPALVNDLAAIPGSPAEGGWTSGGLIRLFLSR